MKGILFALCYILSALYYFVQSASEAKFMTKITSTVKKKKKKKKKDTKILKAVELTV